MKKIILAIFCLSGTFAYSQTGLTIGDKVVFGHSWTVGNKPSNAKYRFHPYFQIGRSAVYHFGDHAGLGLGTFFSTEGGSYYNDNSNIRTDMRMNYIRIPVFGNFVFGDPANRVRPMLNIGPSVGFLVGGKVLGKTDNDVLAGLKTTKYMGTKIDAGVNASLGWDIRVMEGLHLNHEIAYYHGLTENEPAVPGAPSFTHRGIGLSMGMQISPDAMRKWKQKMHSEKGGWEHHRRKAMMR